MGFYFEQFIFQKLAKKQISKFHSSISFPQISIYNFFETEVLDMILAKSFMPNQKMLHNYHFEKEFNEKVKIGEFTLNIKCQFNSVAFLYFFETLTGVLDLISCPYFYEGKLSVQNNYSKHKKWTFNIRISAPSNVSNYCMEEYNSHLERRKNTIPKVIKRFTPIFNRLFVFSDTNFNLFGIPDEVNYPEGMILKSMAIVYFTNGNPSYDIDHNKKLHVQFKESQFDAKSTKIDAKTLINYKVNLIKGSFKGITPLYVFNLV